MSPAEGVVDGMLLLPATSVYFTSRRRRAPVIALDRISPGAGVERRLLAPLRDPRKPASPASHTHLVSHLSPCARGERGTAEADPDLGFDFEEVAPGRLVPWLIDASRPNRKAG